MSASGTLVTSPEDDRIERLAKLDHWETEVLDRLARGHRAAAVASHLVVPLSTVRGRIDVMLFKLNVATQLEATALHRGHALR